MYDCVVHYLNSTGLMREDMREVEQVASFLFKQLAVAIYHLHEELRVIHRDVKLDNILFSSTEMLVKLTDFTVAR